MHFLKRFFITLLILGVTAFTLHYFRAEIIKILSYRDCDKPITYKLGNLDPKFGLSKEKALISIKKAADIWNNAYGKTLLSESSSAILTVNFVYDERSALNTNINQTKDTLELGNTNLQEQIDSYESDLAKLEKKLNDYNSRVAEVNRTGGASPDLYKKFLSEQKQLASESENLNIRAEKLSLATNDFNSKIDKLNQNVNEYNQALEQKPEGGLYDGNDNTITIYIEGSPEELIHILAHEFGHALGMGHTIEPDSIMYESVSSYLIATSEDLQQLDFVCREQLLPMLWLKDFSLWVRSMTSL